MRAGHVDIAGITDTGRLRQVNQDDWHADARAGICAVADGMGGHAHGEEASQLALNVLRERLRHNDAPDDSLSQIIIEAVRCANHEIFQRNVALGHSAGSGMGTTLTGVYHGPPTGSHLSANGNEGAVIEAEIDTAVRNSHAVLFNVGDSRVYRFRDGRLDTLTRDHTLYREWEEAGAKGNAPPKNIILRALGLFDSVDVDVTPIDSCSGDLFLLCSDGLNDMLEHAALHQCLAHWAASPAATIAQQLVDAANQAGGEDNITVIIIKHLANQSP